MSSAPLLLSLSVICAGLTLISAIAYQIGKKPAMKMFSTSMHLWGFLAFAAGMFITYVVFPLNEGLNLHKLILGAFKTPRVYVILAGWIISSIPIGGKNDNV